MDTLSGLYTRSLGTGAEASAKVELTASDLQDLFHAAVETRFWDLPPVVEAQPNADGTVTVTSPSTLYEIEVRQNGTSHTVRYNDGVTSSAEDPRIQRFNALFTRVLRLLREKPEVKALPAFQVMCL